MRLEPNILKTAVLDSSYLATIANY